jgi:hypothetical protein
MDILSESFNRIKLLINYDVSKSATENLFSEQKPDFGGYDILNPMNPNYGKKTNEDPLGLKNWDVHDWFTLVQVVLLFLGLFTGGTTSIIALALGSIVDVTEAGIFLVKDKDPYMATVMFILSFLGINDLMKIPIVKKYGIEGTKQLIRKAQEGVELTADEAKDLKKLGEHIVKNSKEFIPLIKKTIRLQVTKYLSKKSLKWLLNLMIILNKGKLPLLVAGTWISFDNFYVYVFRDDIKKMKLRNENTFIQIVKFVESLLDGKEINNEEFVKQNIPMDSTSLKNDLLKIDTTKVDMNKANDRIMKELGLI